MGGRKYELTLLPSYVSEWDFTDAIRELIQNGIDQQAMDPTKEFSINYSQEKNELLLSNANTGLEINTLLLGSTTKSRDDGTVGQFGEGYKIAALVLNRIGKSFTIVNGRKNEIWTSKFEMSEKWNEEILSFYIESRRLETDTLTIQIGNVSIYEFRRLYDIWIDMDSGERVSGRISTKYGEILTAPDMGGKLYVNGLYIEKSVSKHYGYNIKSQYIRLERDRKSCNTADLYRMTSRMIYEALINGDLSSNEVMRIANNQHKTDIDFLQYEVTNNDFDKIVRMFIKEFDAEYADSIPVHKQERYDFVKKLGGNPVFVSCTLYGLLEEESQNRIMQLSQVSLSATTISDKLSTWFELYEGYLPSHAQRQFRRIIDELIEYERKQ